VTSEEIGLIAHVLQTARFEYKKLPELYNLSKVDDAYFDPTHWGEEAAHALIDLIAEIFIEEFVEQDPTFLRTKFFEATKNWSTGYE
jgi:hypothetical protein